MRSQIPCLTRPQPFGRGIFAPMRNFGFYEAMKEFYGKPDGPPIESSEVSLTFTLLPGGSSSQIVPATGGVRWITDINYTLSGANAVLVDPAELRVSSWINPDKDDDSKIVVVTEDQPLSLVFGTAERQRAIFPRRHESTDLRLFEIFNTTRLPITVNLSIQSLVMAG